MALAHPVATRFAPELFRASPSLAPLPQAAGAGGGQAAKRPSEPMKRLLVLLARAWQIGPSRVLPPTCRYAPSCSQYAIEALEKHGAIKGGWLALKRLLRCHPWGGHGYDPVP